MDKKKIEGLEIAKCSVEWMREHLHNYINKAKIQQMIPNIEFAVEETADAFILQMKNKYLQNKHKETTEFEMTEETVSYPKNKIQMLKEIFIPKILQKGILKPEYEIEPIVKKTVIKEYNICPHLDSKAYPPHRHLEFLLHKGQ